EVCRVANVMKQFGVKKGDRVALYMPMVPELAFSMLACARIGAVHTVIFAGFSAESVRGRLRDSGAKLIITSNVVLRGPKTINLKEIVDEALAGTNSVKTVLVHKRTDDPCPMTDGRDHLLAEEMSKQSDECPCEEMDAEDPLYL